MCVIRGSRDPSGSGPPRENWACLASRLIVTADVGSAAAIALELAARALRSSSCARWNAIVIFTTCQTGKMSHLRSATVWGRAFAWRQHPINDDLEHAGIQKLESGGRDVPFALRKSEPDVSGQKTGQGGAPHVWRRPRHPGGVQRVFQPLIRSLIAACWMMVFRLCSV